MGRDWPGLAAAAELLGALGQVTLPLSLSFLTCEMDVLPPLTTEL